MTDHSPEAIERIAAAPWCYASEDISAALRSLEDSQAMVESLKLRLIAAQGEASAAVDTAVLVERERCALKLEEILTEAYDGLTPAQILLMSPADNMATEMVKSLAAAIRKGPTP